MKVSVITSLCLGLIFISCKTHIIEPEGMPESMRFSNEGCVHKQNGMLAFNDWEAFLSTMEEFGRLEANYQTPVVDALPGEQGETENDANTASKSGGSATADFEAGSSPVLTAFENKYNHLSLRRHIITLENQAFASGAWSEENDPDNHFISDPYIRTILNANLEVKVGENIYKYIDKFNYVEIVGGNIETLNEIRRDPNVACIRENVNIIRNIERQIGDQPKIRCLEPIIKGAKTNFTLCIASFDVAIDGSVVTFTNTSRGYDSAIEDNYWDFGDGSSEINNSKEVIHDYGGNGEFLVSLKVDGSECDMSINEELKIYINDCPTPNFKYELDGNVVFFENTSINADYYEWNIYQDGSNIYSGVVLDKREFPSIGVYEVCLKAGNSLCTIEPEECKEITILEDFQVSKCCDKTDRNKDVYKDIEDGTRKIKGVLWQTNFLGYHRVGVKTKSYKKNWLGIWRLSNAEEIGAKISGSVYLEDETGADCSEEKVLKDGNGNDYELGGENDNKVKFNVKIGNTFWTKPGSLKGEHYITVNGKRYSVKTKLNDKSGC